ncbi:MAG: hypothetical protein K2P58_12055 [Hyphomonadaceae bacterium]|nr:hypothetical protein [Hyphomonadaceae bacterium]
MSALNADPFFDLRDRAYQLADSGRYKHWRQVAYALLAEGFASSLIQRLDADALAVMMISRCCAQARAASSRLMH